MQKIDFKKSLKDLYQPSARTAALVDVPQMNFVMIDGAGKPEDNPEFQEAIEALYGIAYTLKFMFKNSAKPEGFFEYVVPPLEGLWWMKDDGDFETGRSEDWRWTLMIMQPRFFTAAMIDDAAALLHEKKNPAALEKARFDSITEGLSAQIMHRGPYDDEGPSIARLMEFIAGEGYIVHGRHHEIYLSDPRRTAPEKLKTVLRYPVRKA